MSRAKPARANYRVPIGVDGAVLHYPEKVRRPNPEATYGYDYVDCEWRDNEPFQATLTIGGTVSGRSAKYFIWNDAEGCSFPMFATDMVDLLRYATVEPLGVVRGFWTVRKRGGNYGISFYEAV